jgi:MFS family permease
MQTGNNVAGNSKKEAQFSHIINMRGGAIPKLANMTPTSFFDYTFLVLAAVAGSLKIVQSKLGSVNKTAEEKPAAVKSLQARFLVVFWLMRMADWMQGPYFYELYSSKIIGGVPVTMDMVSKLFLIGFASTGVFGPYIGRLVDSVGRKAGTLAFAALYSVSALSTLSSSLTVLMLGRLAGGLGTSLLFSAPEAWFAGEFFKSGFDPKWLGQTFGWAYAVDSLVAISAGQLASVAASRKGPSGPFVVSLVFLALGSVIASLKWKENTAAPSTPATSDDSSPAEKQKTSGT